MVDDDGRITVNHERDGEPPSGRGCSRTCCCTSASATPTRTAAGRDRRIRPRLHRRVLRGGQPVRGDRAASAGHWCCSGPARRRRAVADPPLARHRRAGGVRRASARTAPGPAWCRPRPDCGCRAAEAAGWDRSGSRTGWPTAATEAIDAAGGGTRPDTRTGGRCASGTARCRWFVSSFPLLGAVAAGFTLVPTRTWPGRGTSRSPRSTPSTARSTSTRTRALSAEEWRFVLAHEMLHAALRPRPTASPAATRTCGTSPATT